MALAHCSVLCSSQPEPSLPGAGEAGPCCQSALPSISQPGEVLTVHSQGSVFLQEDNFIIKM